MRARGVAALARHDNLELVGGGIKRARTSRELARGEAGAVVNAEDRVHRKAIEQSVADHRAGAAIGIAARPLIAERFLGGLKDQVHLAVEIARRGEMFRGAKQHRRVPVMAAGVHHARGAGFMVGLGQFAHRQCVDVGADADRAVRLPGADRRDDAGPADAGRDLVDPEAFEQVEDEANRVLFVKTEFGVLMDMPAPGGHVSFEWCQVNGHGDAPPGAAARSG